MHNNADHSVDLRSDTVTQPCAAMWDAMRSAPLGDDVLGDEPTVARLETMIAARLGKEAAVFVPSGTMANQLAIRVACGAGDEIIAHEESHIIHYETAYLKLYFFVFLLITSIFIYQFSPLVQIRALRTIEETSQIFNPNPVTSVRLQYFQLSTQLFLKHPIIGNGPGSFKTANSLRDIESHLKTHLHTHNEYLTLLTQYGLIGFSLFSLIVYFSGRNLYKDHTNPYHKVIFIGLVLFLLNSLTESMLYMEAYILVFLMGLCHVVSESSLFSSSKPLRL